MRSLSAQLLLTITWASSVCFAGPPVIRRDVPHHELSVLASCSASEVEQLRDGIEGAIASGAPVYNAGNHDECFRTYEAAIVHFDASLKGCARARAALGAGLKKARELDSSTAKAWALRDAFDGMLDVISRQTSADAEPTTRAAVTRAVPRHALFLVAECSQAQLREIAGGMAAAIDVGAPLYNQGKIEACYRVYQGASLDLIRTQGSCAGAASALEKGLARAAAAPSVDAKAWAMRDTFDGLLEVIERRFTKEK